MASVGYQPDISAALGLINHLSNDELKEMLNDDSKFDDMLTDLNQFKNLESTKQMLLGQISSLVECNLLKEPQLVEGKERVQELSEKGELHSKSVEEKMQELRSKNGDTSAETVLALLQTAAAEMEEESENIASNFLNGSMDIDEFLTQFAEKRNLMHLRKVKVDKMTELISRRPLINHVPNYINAPPVTINSNYFPNAVTENMSRDPIPYPTGPFHMPLPGSYFPNTY